MMGVSIRLDGPDGTHRAELCTGLGWTRAAEWLQSLPEADFPAPVAFAHAETFRDTAKLAVELEAAFQSRRPADGEVAATVDRLLNSLGDGRPDETVTVEY